MIKLKPGVVIMIMGMGGLMFELASPSLRIIEKILLTIICICLIIFGVLIESPKFVWISDDPIEHEEFY